MNDNLEHPSGMRPICCRKLEGGIKNRGMRMTIPRQLVAEVLETSEAYLSAEDIFLKIKNEYPAIGLATVYRTLTLMEEMGLVCRHNFDEGKARYFVVKKSSEKHICQFICEKCCKVFNLPNSLSEDFRLYQEIEQSLVSDYGFEIKKHISQFSGLCPSCKNIYNKTGEKE